MEQRSDLADNRFINGCIYCSGISDTRDPVIRVRFQLKPSDAFAVVIGTEQVARPQDIKKLYH